MFKNKAINGSNSRQNKLPPRPKPQFTTDFVDREKYKLSESEMIQKKASLQSKHRDQAIQNLNERRRKLQQGIIDDDTRKVYETALTSKKIDINPPIRKNLSQMIRMQRDKQEQMRSSSRERQRPRPQWGSKDNNQVQSQEDDSREDIQKQLKQTRDFIKKFQRAKKVDNIERAVEILADSPYEPKQRSKRSIQKQKQKKPKTKNPMSNDKILHEMQDSRTSAMSSQEQALSSIEDTIRFMEQRLFSAKRIQKIKQEQVDKLKESSTSYEPFTGYSHQVKTKENLQLSGLGHHDSDSEEEECMQTIRRMKQMMQGSEHDSSPYKQKQNQEAISNQAARFEGFSTLQKVSPHIHVAESEAEVDFSLTMNDSDHPELNHSDISLHRQIQRQVSREERQYQRLKNSLFDEVNRLQLHTPQVSISEPSFTAKSSLPIDQSSIRNIRATPTPASKPKKVNPDLARLRNQINGVKNNVQSIKVEPLQITRPGEVMGVDFRGSINIKKHIVQS